jgi:hypothetical protein
MTTLVDLYLATRLGPQGWTFYAPLTEDDRAEIEEQQAQGTEPPEELETFVAVGALSAPEADAWRRRFAAADERYDPPPGTRERAMEYLRDIRSSATEEKASAVELVYESLGFTEPEDAAWGEEPSVEDFVEHAEVAPVFQRAVAGPTPRIGGMQVIFAAVYHSELALHWDFAPGFQSEAAARTELLLHHRDAMPDDVGAVFVVTDDVGTTYYATGGAYGYRTGTHTFEPAPPANATELRIAVAGERATLAL